MSNAMLSSSSAGHTRPRTHRFVSLMSGIGAVLALLSLVLALAPFSPTHSVRADPATVRVKAYYLALGTSLAFGQQPTGDFEHSYPQQWFDLLHPEGSKALINYGCPGNTSDDMINGHGCSLYHTGDEYPGQSQLQAGLAFIAAHPNQVSPVSLDMGSNDVLPLFAPKFDFTTGVWDCSYDATAVANAEDHLDANLTGTILPDLVQALGGKGGQHNDKGGHQNQTGDLVMMNYYFPFQNVCPQVLPEFEAFNTRLANDAATVAATYGVTIRMADVFTAFGGAQTPNSNLCTYTWFCPFTSFDPHATTTGYGVIAQTFNSFVGD